MKQLFSIFERTTDGAMIVDQDGKIIFWNLAAQRLLGFQTREVIGRPCCEVIRGETLSGRPLCSPTCPIADRTAGAGFGVAPSRSRACHSPVFPHDRKDPRA